MCTTEPAAGQAVKSADTVAVKRKNAMRKIRSDVNSQRVAEPVVDGAAGTCPPDGAAAAPAVGPALGGVCDPSGGVAPVAEP